MEETDDSLDDWRELMTTSSGLFSGITIMSNPEPNLEDDEIRVGSVVLIENTAADFSDAASPLVSSPRCLTIPSGISPHELLGSPVMLPNSQMSPTTGTLGSTPPPGVPLSDKLQDGGDDVSSFGHSDPVSFPCYPPSHNQVYSGENLTSEDDCQSLVCMQSPTNFEFVGEEEKVRAKSYGMKGECGGFQLSSHSYGVADKEMREAKIVNGGGGGESVDGMKKGVHPNPTKTSEDGYNWRKYGQKQVKGSEYPRSYFKCTHPSCLVKKKVERSHHGEITEIIYKGDHNHGTPQPTRRSTFGSAPEPVWKELQQQQQQQEQVVVVVGGSEWKSSTPQVCDNQKTVSSVETPELCSHEEEEEEDTTTTQGSLSVGEDDDAESESKRRKKESCLIETALGSRALREPRVIVQIESEVDIIDDGYRWRKYGQKVVKGNPNPRSYYKCTSGGCTVRKHVERASHNLKYVLTTYEGKHNHVVPAARNGNGNGNMNGNGNGNGNGARNCHLPKAEGQELDRKMEYSSDFLRSNYGGLMKLPTVGSYNYIPSLSMSFPLTLSFPSTFGMPAYNTQPPLPSFFVDHHIKGMLTPKQERRD